MNSFVLLLMHGVVEKVSESEEAGITYSDESVQDDKIRRLAGFDVLYMCAILE